MTNQVQFAPVCPLPIYKRLYTESVLMDQPEILGNYFLLLAHDILTNKEAYQDFFVDKWDHTFFGDPTIIVDNSVIELGEACSAQAIREAAEVVNATCVAIPDVLCEGEGTFLKAIAFVKEWITMPISPIDLMFIPQGKNQNDFVRCYEETMQELGECIQWIGVPRNLTGRVFSTRQFAVAYIDSRLEKHKMIHMLGFSDNIADDILTCKRFRNRIAGIDSAVPLREGDIRCSRTGGYIQPPRRGDWWETVQKDLTLNSHLEFRHGVLQTRQLLCQGTRNESRHAMWHESQRLAKVFGYKGPQYNPEYVKTE